MHTYGRKQSICINSNFFAQESLIYIIMEKTYKWNEINMMMPIEEWCLTLGTPISLQWDYYTCDRFEKLIPFEKVLVSKYPSCRIIPPKYMHTYDGRQSICIIGKLLHEGV